MNAFFFAGVFMLPVVFTVRNGAQLMSLPELRNLQLQFIEIFNWLCRIVESPAMFEEQK